MGTLNLPPYSNLQEDCKDLRNAFKVLGSNEKKVIDILGRRPQAQRADIAQAYQTVYGESLHKRLKSSFNGKLEKCILLWMMDASERDAVFLYEALRGGGKRGDRAVIGIVCTRTSGQLYLIKQAYYTMFNQTLENHIDGSDAHFLEFQQKNTMRISIHGAPSCMNINLLPLLFLEHSKWAFWRASEQRTKEAPRRLSSITKLLLALVRGSRPENQSVDRHIALSDAHQLNKVCIGKSGNEDTMIRIFSTRSSHQLTATLNFYHQHYGHDFEKALNRKNSGEFEQALRAVVQCFRQPAKFYAEELYAALGGLGTDDDALIRVITTRAEVDMQYIKLEFTNESKKSLEEMIINDTVGNYRYFLLTLIGHDMGLFSPRSSNGSLSYHSPRSSGSRQPSSGSQNGSAASYYSPRSSGQESIQLT